MFIVYVVLTVFALKFLLILSAIAGNFDDLRKEIWIDEAQQNTKSHLRFKLFDTQIKNHQVFLETNKCL